MNPGRLDKRIALQVKVQTRTADGGWSDAWTDAVNLWAEALPQTARETQAVRAVHATVEQVFRIRYYADLNEADYRITHDSRTYDIVGITEEGRNTTQLVACEFTEGAL